MKSNVELRKCEILRKAAYSRDIRPEFTCIISSDCVHNVQTNQSDVTVLAANEQEKAKASLLNPILLEYLDEHYVIVARKDLSEEDMKKANMWVVPLKHILPPLNSIESHFRQFDGVDERSRDAALLFNYKRGNQQCVGVSTEPSVVRVMRASQLKGSSLGDQDELICSNFIRKSVATWDLTDCYFDATPPTAVFVRNSLSGHDLDNVAHAFIALSDKFGHGGKIEDVFSLFGEFEAGQRDVIFTDKAGYFTQISNFISNVDDEMYNHIRCLWARVGDELMRNKESIPIWNWDFSISSSPPSFDSSRIR